jgi:hypothetical protein
MAFCITGPGPFSRADSGSSYNPIIVPGTCNFSISSSVLNDYKDISREFVSNVKNRLPEEFLFMIDEFNTKYG